MALTDNLICYYKLDGDSTDIFGSNGTDTNITYSSANGKLTQGAWFNGTSSKIVNNGIVSLLANSTVGTISFWANITSTGDERILFAISVSSGSQSEFFIDWRDDFNKCLLFVIKKDGVNQTVLQSNNNTLTSWQGSWNHFCLIQDGVSVKLYVNSVLTNFAGINSTAWFKSAITDATTKANVSRLGTLARSGSEIAFYNGKLDEFAIWDRALSQGEINDLYLGGNGSQYPFRDKGFLMF